MKPLIILLIIFVVSLVAFRFLRQTYEVALSARIAMSVMLVFTAIGHFAFAKGMAMMVPDIVPFKKEVVYFTGLIEIMAAVGLLIPRFQALTAWLLILFFVLILPANIKAAMEHIDLQKGTYDGNGPAYLWFRVPLQILFIAWVYLSTIRG